MGALKDRVFTVSELEFIKLNGHMVFDFASLLESLGRFKGKQKEDEVYAKVTRLKEKVRLEVADMRLVFALQEIVILYHLRDAVVPEQKEGATYLDYLMKKVRYNEFLCNCAKYIAGEKDREFLEYEFYLIQEVVELLESCREVWQ